VLVVIGRADEVGAKSVRNLPGVHVISPDQLNTYDVLNSDDVVFTWRPWTPSSREHETTEEVA
jgi:large subunit ribosomal protein L4